MSYDISFRAKVEGTYVTQDFVNIYFCPMCRRRFGDE